MVALQEGGRILNNLKRHYEGSQKSPEFAKIIFYKSITKDLKNRPVYDRMCM